MASIACSSFTPLVPCCFPLTGSRLYPSLSFSYSNHTTRPFYRSVKLQRNYRTKVFASSSAVWEFTDGARSKNSILLSLIQDIEPLDVTVIRKDVPPTTVDAIKRTISAMLGVLPFQQFQVMVEASWEPLFKMLVSSMITGYTLRNVEHRLFLEIHDENMDKSESQDETRVSRPGEESLPTSKDHGDQLMYNIPDFGAMTPEAREYILKLHSSLSSVKKELHEVKRTKTAAPANNDVLEYLRSLEPETVAELSEPTSPELKNMIHSVVHGLLATLSPNMHLKGPGMGDNKGSLDSKTGRNIFHQFQPHLSLRRDNLAGLLFWCMLLGHYIRGLEYRLELKECLSLAGAPSGNSAV